MDGRKKKASKSKKKGTKANNKEAEAKKVLTLEEKAELEYQEQVQKRSELRRANLWPEPEIKIFFG